MHCITTDDLAHVLARHQGSPSAAFRAARRLFGIKLDALPLEESAGWLRRLDTDLLAIAADPEHTSLWPLLGDLRKLAAARLSDMLGGDLHFADRDDLLRQLDLDGADDFARWVEGATEDGNVFAVDVSIDNWKASGTLLNGARPIDFEVAFPMLESSLRAAILEAEEQSDDAFRAQDLRARIEEPDDGEVPDASWIRTAGQLPLCDEDGYIRTLLELAELVGIQPSATLRRGNALRSSALRELQDQLVSELGLPEQPAEATAAAGRRAAG